MTARDYSRVARRLGRIAALPAQAPGIEFCRSIVRNRFPSSVHRHNTVGSMNRSN